ncbi:MAG: chemotaxis protein CheW [Lentisphaeraceae bacterium]|nr:chemotaxis protein CheW [Lentisphaeraceae bacterium]
MSEKYRSFVVFRIKDLYCAFDCLDVQEIIRETKQVKSICRADEHIMGVINLRGEIVTVISLKKFFDFDEKVNDSSIIVTKTSKEHLGYGVTEIADVVEIPIKAIESSPTVPEGLETQYIGGVFEWKSELVTVLESERLADIREVTA